MLPARGSLVVPLSAESTARLPARRWGEPLFAQGSFGEGRGIFWGDIFFLFVIFGRFVRRNFHRLRENIERDKEIQRLENVRKKANASEMFGEGSQVWNLPALATAGGCREETGIKPPRIPNPRAGPGPGGPALQPGRE